MPTQTVQSFFEDFNTILSTAKRGKILDFLFDNIEDSLIADQFDYVNGILQSLDIQSLEIVYLLAFLNLTKHWKQSLPYRDTFYALVSERLTTEDPKRKEALLMNLD